jgi:hypothetical protein
MNNIFGNYNPLSILYTNASKLLISSSPQTNYIKRLDNSTKTINNLNLMIFDMNGVLKIGKEPLEIAKNTFNKLTEQNIPICIITNECRNTPKTISKELKQMGYNINPNIKVFSASLLMLNKVDRIISKFIDNNPYKKKINFGIISEQSFYQYIKQNTINKYNNVKFYWIYDNIQPNNIDYFIIGSIDNNDELLNNITRFNKWIETNQKAKYLLTRSDIITVENMKNVINIYPKMIIQLIINLKKDDIIKETDIKIQKKKEENLLIFKNYLNYYTQILSKPNTKYFKQQIESFYGLEFNKVNKKNNKILLIGDNINTDIKFANKLNISSCLVLSGVTKYKDLKQINDENIIKKIDYILPDISYLLD